MILRDEGHEVTAVHSGRNVLNAVIRGANLDVIVLDINLPDVSGWQVAQTLRARGAKRPVDRHQWRLQDRR
jgi:CheY-like chemotaxis protein